MIHIGKGIIKYNKAMSLQETIQKIKNLTSEQLLAISNEVFDFDQFSHLQYYADAGSGSVLFSSTHST